MKIVPIVSASVLAGALLFSVIVFTPSASKESRVAGSPIVIVSPTATPTTATADATTTSNPSDEPSISNGTDDSVSVNSPSNVDISEVTNDSFKAYWSEPLNTVGKITQYSILVKENGVTTGTYYTAENNYVVAGLTSNNAYQVEVRAFAVSESGLKQATSNRATSRTVVTSSPRLAEIPAAYESAPAAIPTPEKAPEPTVDQATIGKIVTNVSGYYKFVSSAGSLDKVKQAKSKYDGRSNLTDTELTELVASFQEGFRYFDTSSSQNINNAYNQLLARTTQSDKKPGATVVVPQEAISVKGDTAIVNSSKIKITLNAEVYSATETPYFELNEISLVKNKDGSWVIIAEAPRQSIP